MWPALIAGETASTVSRAIIELMMTTVHYPWRRGRVCARIEAQPGVELRKSTRYLSPCNGLRIWINLPKSAHDGVEAAVKCARI